MRSYPDTVKAVRALREGGIECVVGRGILPKLDIQFCDIVVPVISDLEKEAILETGEGGREIVYHYDKVCDPLYEARTNREFESTSSRRWGKTPPACIRFPKSRSCTTSWRAPRSSATTV